MLRLFSSASDESHPRGQPEAEILAVVVVVGALQSLDCTRNLLSRASFAIRGPHEARIVMERPVLILSTLSEAEK